jgi:hypothetical protein
MTRSGGGGRTAPLWSQVQDQQEGDEDAGVLELEGEDERGCIDGLLPVSRERRRFTVGRAIALGRRLIYDLRLERRWPWP